MNNSLIIALDFPGKQAVEQFLVKFGDEKLFLKVGMELFYEEGPSIVRFLKDAGHDVFLDLKLYDIPNTVGSAMKRLAKLECDLVNVHAAGGKDMMNAALEGLEAGTAAGKSRPKLIAVTQLTSTSEAQMQVEQKIPLTLNESVMHYAGLAKEASLDGVVCSVFESAQIHGNLGGGFLTVTPGIRLANDDAQDQKRVATPQYARNEGVSAIVVGRSITSAADPLQAYQNIKQLWDGVLL